MKNSKQELSKPNFRLIKVERFSIKKAFNHLIIHIQNLLDVYEEEAIIVFNDQLKNHLDQFKNSISIVVETPYVDRVYRDSYYNYFSSKHWIYTKDCVKLSFFDKRRYCGFMVLRPTSKNIVGRSIISPKALNNCNFKICTTSFESTVQCIKYKVEGFPHSSQDQETITCAETSLWALMEYFGNKYPNYQPVLPSKIVEVLRGTSYERQIPSNGLYFDQISYALREFCFGTRIYTLNSYRSDEFKRLFSCYVESGIPLIVEIRTSKYNEDSSVAHAILCIGHGDVTVEMVDNLSITEEQFIDDKGNVEIFKYYDGDGLDKEFIFIDDTRPVYQQAQFNTPNQDREDYKINKFIVPLYPKVYLEAFQAKKYCIGVLKEKFNIPITDDPKIYLRFFLTSSRSLKDKMSTTNSHNEDLISFILESPMPKFVWVGEISSKTLIKNKKADGLIIIDATEANTSDLKPLIIAAYSNKMFLSTMQKNPFEISIKEFDIFANNLK